MREAFVETLNLAVTPDTMAIVVRYPEGGFEDALKVAQDLARARTWPAHIAERRLPILIIPDHVTIDTMTEECLRRLGWHRT